MGRVRRNWTAEEDNMLRRAVQQGTFLATPLCASPWLCANTI